MSHKELIETRQKGVFSFEIYKDVADDFPFSWLDLGQFTDRLEVYETVYVDRRTRKLHQPNRKPQDTKQHVYWDKYTGGIPTDECPYWVAPLNGTTPLETYRRAETYGSEWCMEVYTCKALVDKLPFAEQSVFCASDVEVDIDHLIALTEEEIQVTYDRWKDLLRKVENAKE